MKCDFSGWASKANLLCSDGRIITSNAFIEDDGKEVPLVWNHQHNNPANILGKCLLKHSAEGVYAYGFFNDTEDAQIAKKLLQHGDITGMSICANNLKHKDSKVLHGKIREVSLVLATCNPGASINNVLMHGEFSDDEAIIFTGEELELTHSCVKTPKKKEELQHSNEEEKNSTPKKDESKKEQEKMDTKETQSSETKEEKTISEIINSLNEEQKDALYYMVGKALENKSSDDEEKGEEEMKHNVFDKNDDEQTVLMHSDEVEIIKRAKKTGSLKDAIADYIDNSETLSHGFSDEDLNYLFPEFKDVKPGAPELITRDHTWVQAVINGVHKSPISRIRTRFMDVRGKDLRAHGYKKSSKKKEMLNPALLQRTTDPQTVYIKDKLNRDDITDITDFDVVSYQYGIMRSLLNEELAMAFLVGDGREITDEQKIKEEHIRPVWKDNEMYTIHVDVDIDAAKKELQGTSTSANFGENYIYAEAIIAARLYGSEKYKGSGNVTMYCTPHMLNKMLLARDLNGRRIYSSKSELAAALNVKDIETVEQFEGLTRVDGEGVSAKTKELLALFVNMNDYQVGSTKGGEITQFNQFDIDFNQEKYLIETRVSAALVRPWSAIALEMDVTAGE